MPGRSVREQCPCHPTRHPWTQALVGAGFSPALPALSHMNGCCRVAVPHLPWANSVPPRAQATIRGLKSQVSELEAAAASLRAEAAMARRQQEAAAREAAAARAARGQAEAELRQQVRARERG